MANNKKSVQRGCAKRSDRQKRSSNNITSRQRRKSRSRSVKQRGGDLHKMYNYNNLQVDPQRMITMDKGTVQTGGSQTLYKGTGGKHRHSRKYYKRSIPLTSGGSALNFSAVENLVYKATAVPMFNNATTIQTNMKVPAHV
jgi:hypothetical protein